MYDYYLGGKDNFAADRETAENAQGSWPTIRVSARENRVLLGGLELMPPGVVVTSEWRPEGDGPRPMPAEVNTNGGVARKPQ